MSKPNARDRRTVERRRDLDQYSGPYRLEDLPELQHGAVLVLDSWYDETSVYLAWEELESEEEWRARVKKLDAAAARRAKNPTPRKSKEQRLLEQARQKLTPEELAALVRDARNSLTMS
jgi:hypothetical protein